MRVKELKELIEDLDDDSEIVFLLTNEEGEVDKKISAIDTELDHGNVIVYLEEQ